MKRHAWLLALALMALAPAARGEGYIGLGGGKSDADISVEAEEVLFGIGGECGLNVTCAFDESDTGFKIFGGNRFNPYFALELSYIDFGEFSATAVGPSTSGGTLRFRLLADVWAIGIAGLGLIPAGRFDVFVKAGAAYWSADLTASAIDTVFGAVSETDTRDGGNLLWGAGLQWNGERVSLRAEFERVDVDEIDIDLVSASAIFRF
ncbi:MAG TPA: outer membrane beta-barrel protein [Burkholderiales bacterium]